MSTKTVNAGLLKACLLGAASTLAFGVAGAPALAQEGARPEVETLIVTTQLREESELEVPINLTAIREDFLEQYDIDDLDELARFVPGLFIQEQSPNNPGFVIRGITSDSGESNIEPRVSVFLNGVSISRSRGSIVELFDIERVEVAKGPQGTLFGRSAQIGAVSIITNKAEDEYSAEAFVGAGNFGEFTAGGHVNVPIVDDILFGRIAGIRRVRDGYIESLNPEEEDFQGTAVTALRASLGFEPTSDFRFDLVANYQHDTPPGTSFKSGVIPALGGNANPNDPAFLNTFGDSSVAIVPDLTSPALFSPLPVSTAPLGGGLRTDREVWDVTLLGEWQVNDVWSINSTTAYRQFDSFELFDPDGSAFPFIITAEDASGDQFSHDMRANFEFSDRLRGFVGGGVFVENGEQQVPFAFDERFLVPLIGTFTLTQPAGPGAQNLDFGFLGLPDDIGLGIVQAILSGNPAAFDPFLTSPLLPFGQLSPFVLENFRNESRNTSFDLFADVTYEVLPGLELTGGIRYTRDDKETGFIAGNQIAPTVTIASGLLGAGIDPSALPPFSLPNNFPGTPAQIPATTLIFADTRNTLVESGNETFDDVVWRFVANYEAADNINLYASVSRGRRPEVIAPDFAVDQTSGLQTQFAGFEIIPAEIVNSFEVGAKGVFYDGRVQASGSVFYYDYNNFQTSAETSPGVVETINAGTADAVGVETQIFGQITDYLDAFITYGYNRARFDDEDDSGNPQVFGGNAFRLSPDHLLAVGGTFRAPLHEDWDFFLSPSYTWQSEIFFDEDNLPLTTVFDPSGTVPVFTIPAEQQDSYGLLNIRTGFENENMVLSFYVENLTDEEFIIDAGNTGGTFGIPTFIAGPPRQFGGEIRVRF